MFKFIKINKENIIFQITLFRKDLLLEIRKEKLYSDQDELSKLKTES